MHSIADATGKYHQFPISLLLLYLTSPNGLYQVSSWHKSACLALVPVHLAPVHVHPLAL